MATPSAPEPDGAPPPEEAPDSLRRDQATPPSQDGFAPIGNVSDEIADSHAPGGIDNATDSPNEGGQGRDLMFDLDTDSGVTSEGEGLDLEDVISRGEMVQASPERRSFRRFVKEARSQSMGTGARYSVAADHLSSVQEDRDEREEGPGRKIRLESGAPVIDGRKLTIAARGLSTRNFGAVRLWDKTLWHQLAAEAKLAFENAAVKYLFPKGQKLATPSYDSSSEMLLVRVETPQSQIKTLRGHATLCDMGDVMTIVVPADVKHTMKVERRCYDLFEDYSQLHPEIVANSCAWYNRWVTNPCVKENMVLTHVLLHNNTEPELWHKCMESYEDYSPMQQGGPLMLCLILLRAQDQSEQALTHLKDSVDRLNISKLTGEDAEKGARLLKSTYRALKGASTKNRTCAPMDFAKSIYEVLQTSSVREFNDIFRTQARDLQTVADMEGTQPKWPPISQILNLATNTYRRMKSTGQWDGIVSRRSKAFVTLVPRALPAASTQSSTEVICWNCGGRHHLKDCTRPKDQGRIDRARERFNAARRGSGGRTPAQSRYKTGPGGKPLILNKNGYCVLDQRRWRSRQRANLAQHTSTPVVATPAPATPTRDNVSARVASRVDAVRAAAQATRVS